MVKNCKKRSVFENLDTNSLGFDPLQLQILLTSFLLYAKFCPKQISPAWTKKTTSTLLLCANFCSKWIGIMFKNLSRFIYDEMANKQAAYLDSDLNWPNQNSKQFFKILSKIWPRSQHFLSLIQQDHFCNFTYLDQIWNKMPTITYLFRQCFRSLLIFFFNFDIKKQGVCTTNCRSVESILLFNWSNTFSK